jgi:hypothetical protein
MRKHFGHKVVVELDGAVSRVRLPAGTFELEPGAGRLAVRASGEDEAGLERVKEVVASHLVRFARDASVELDWTTTLEEKALALISSHRNAEHLVHTRDWVRKLRPDASEALVLAALTHDVERGVPGVTGLNDQIAAWDDETAVEAHSRRSAEIVVAWLRSESADEALIRQVEELVRIHETGGTEEADVLQAADSLSFLETNPSARWVREGRTTPERAREKLRHMANRIRLAEARRLASPLYEQAVAETDRAAAHLSRGAK